MNDKRILYVEDDFLNGKLFEILFRHEGVRCEVVTDGENAVQLFEAKQYAAVIVDAYLPGLNGEALARRFRAIDRKVPLIGVTSDRSVVESLYRAGFDRVFLKPLRGRDCLDYVLTRL